MLAELMGLKVETESSKIEGNSTSLLESKISSLLRVLISLSIRDSKFVVRDSLSPPLSEDTGYSGVCILKIWSSISLER